MIPPSNTESPLLSRRVGAAVESVNGGGTLTIYPGRILLELDRVTSKLAGRRSIIHTDIDVRMILARLMFPWMNLTLILHDEQVTAAVTQTWRARPLLRRALSLGGFLIHEERAWINIGYSDAR
jgi:hypothetical protein